MSYRALALLPAVILALVIGGCRSSSNKDYNEVLMPRQTGSVFQRRVEVSSSSETKPKKKKTEDTEKTEKAEKKDKKEKPRKPDAEPSATPAPEEESTPAPERFR